MLINSTNLETLFRGFKTSFNEGQQAAKVYHREIAVTVPSSTGEETYGWLGQFPKLREWIGDRVVKNLTAHSFAIKNGLFESTIEIPRTKIEDDQFGMFAPLLQEMGKSSTEHPDELVFGLLATGFSTTCYDGQYFFDTDHPVKDAAGSATVRSNMQSGSGPAWFLLDCSRAVKPMVFQTRLPYTFGAFDRESDGNVFWRDQYVYGVRARVNAGFGLWQLAFASKAALTAENYEAARKTMMELRGDEGRPLGIRPDTLVVTPGHEADAMRLLNNGMRIVTVGETTLAVTNEWAGTAKPIVTPWVMAS